MYNLNQRNMCSFQVLKYYIFNTLYTFIIQSYYKKIKNIKNCANLKAN